MTVKEVTITVAVIGAVATLGAAVISNSNKSKEQSASIQQTASGAGSVNVGRDAVITTTSKSPAEEAAEIVQACEVRHNMKIASEKIDFLETVPATSIEPEKSIEHSDFRSCTWPRSRYADADGYLEIKVQTVGGPGDSEATGTNYADRITAPCKQLVVAYGYGDQGEFRNEDPFTISANTIITIEGKSWANENRDLPFYPTAGEFVVLRNSYFGIQSAMCK